MNFNINNAKVSTLAAVGYNFINLLIDDHGHAVVVQADLFHILNDAGEIKSKGNRKRFVYVSKEHSISFTKTELKNALNPVYFKRLYDGRHKQNTLKLIEYNTAIRTLEKHYHGPKAGLLLRLLLDSQYQVESRAVSRSFIPSKHKTKDEVIDNLKRSNEKWEKAMNSKTAEYNRMRTENENLHNKLAAAAVEVGELQVKNTKLNSEVAELKSTLYDRTVNDTKKSWWQNVKGVFSR